MKSLSIHIAELPGWVTMGLSTSELDFAIIDYKPTEVNSTSELLQLFENSLENGRLLYKTQKKKTFYPHGHCVQVTKYIV